MPRLRSVQNRQHREGWGRGCTADWPLNGCRPPLEGENVLERGGEAAQHCECANCRLAIHPKVSGVLSRDFHLNKKNNKGKWRPGSAAPCVPTVPQHLESGLPHAGHFGSPSAPPVRE